MNWHALRERLCFRFLPPVVDWLVDLSTWHARSTLSRRPLDVLIDVNVFAHAVTHETQWIQTGSSAEWDVPLGYMARVPVHASDCTTRVYNSVKYLPGIARLAKGDVLQLKTSVELRAEEYRLSAARLYGGGGYDYSLLREAQTKSVDTTPFGGYSIQDLADKRLQRARLDTSGDALYRALVGHLKQKRSQDAWHIRTAEAHGCFCFLTMDFDLLDAIDAVKHLGPFPSLKTKVMSPEQLGKHLQLTPIPPIFFSYHDASYPVRPDLHQPDSKRFDWKSTQTAKDR